jgi:hypothetical protein
MGETAILPWYVRGSDVAFAGENNHLQLLKRCFVECAQDKHERRSDSTFSSEARVFESQLGVSPHCAACIEC